MPGAWNMLSALDLNIVTVNKWTFQHLLGGARVVTLVLHTLAWLV